MFSLSGSKPATSGGFGGLGTTGFGTTTGNGARGTTGSLSSNLFGGGTTNPSSGGLAGIPLTRSNSIPAITFGSTTTNAPSSTAPSFGSGTTGTTGMFESTQPALGSSTTGLTGTPAFGSTATSGGLSSFGTLGTSSGTTSSTTQIGFGATKPDNAFGSFGQVASTSTLVGAPSAAQQAVRNGENIPFDTPYKDLPAAYKAELDALYRDFKQPMRQELDLIARSRGQGFDALSQQLRQLHVAVMQLETEQLRLQTEVRPFLDELKPFHRDFRSSSINGLAQIRARGGGGGSASGMMMILDEQLPDRFFSQVADSLEKRLGDSIASVHYFEQQLAARIRVLEARNSSYNGNGGDGMGARGAYGQVLRVSPQMLLQLIKQQASAFAQVAAEVGAVHHLANELRQVFLASQQQRSRGSGSSGRGELNPFEAADRREAAEIKQAEDKIRLEQQQVAVQYHLQMQQQQGRQQQQGSSGTFSTLTAPTSTFGSSTFGLGTSSASTTGTISGTSSFGAFGTSSTTGSTTTAALDLAGTSKGSFGGASPTMSSPFGNALSSGMSPINTKIPGPASFSSLGDTSSLSNSRKNKKK